MPSYELTQIDPFGVLLRPKLEKVDVRDAPIDRLRDLARQHRLLVLRGFAGFDSAEDFAGYCGRWGHVAEWPFGKVLELIEQEEPTDHIFDNNYVPLHWDGMYRPQIPEFQIFHCVGAPLRDQGGRTTFSNTVTALERATPRSRALWGKVTGIYRRKMDYYDSETISPVITMHPVRCFPVIRYNEPPIGGDESFLNHPTLAFTGLTEAEIAGFHRVLREALYAPESLYAHSWQSHDLVIADNYTLLHGREAFTSGAPRHLQRVHVLGDPPFDNPGLRAYR
ncbi:MAG: TauD/TfdA dioxygenase family protein [Myxococcaceae bacterium]